MKNFTRREALKIATNGAAAISLPLIFGSNDCLGSNGLFAPQQASEVKPTIENGIAWFDAGQWGIEGKGWADTLRQYDRLPAKAEKMVRKPVWDLSRHSAGMMTRFATNSNEIKVRYKLTSANLAMNHMPATGVSGVDLYAEDAEGAPRWVNVSRPVKQNVESTLAKGIDVLDNGASRNFSLYLPLYNGVEKLEIGVPAKFSFQTTTVRTNPILFYGTSIMHGACASRPGMSISGILGRRLNRPVINLGFSGNGKMEMPLAELIGELNPSVIAVDCLPNMNGQLVKERTEPFVNRLRELHSETPILLVEDRAFTNSRFFNSRRNHHQASRQNLKSVFDRLTESGVKQLYYLEGEDLLGNDGDGATDGSHPNDLGMMRYADAYEEVLNRILG